jgi:RNA polymerase sigma factor (TIGR02999 family)
LASLTNQKIAMADVTRILDAIEAGDPRAAEQLLPLVYDELRNLAAAKLAHEKPGQTLEATALVHEAYLRLIGPQKGRGWDNRGHFFGAAAEAMRRILVESARRRSRQKRGGQGQRVEMSDALLSVGPPTDEVLAVDEALVKLEIEDAATAELVKLRFFVGLSIEEAAEVLHISRATAYRHWTYAKAWLRCELARSNTNGGEIRDGGPKQ